MSERVFVPKDPDYESRIRASFARQGAMRPAVLRPRPILHAPIRRTAMFPNSRFDAPVGNGLDRSANRTGLRRAGQDPPLRV